jgi:flavodoxin
MVEGKRAGQMKRLLFAASACLCFAFLFFLAGCAGLRTEANFQQLTGNEKILVAYFSRSGNTRALAGIIRQETDGDMFEIKTLKAYPADYGPATEAAKAEKEANARPALAARVDNMDSYDIVFVGYPIWFGTIPMAVCTFLEQYDFSGKTVIAFSTYGRGLSGSGLGESVDDIKQLCPRSVVPGFFIIRGYAAGWAGKDLSDWLYSLGISPNEGG